MKWEGKRVLITGISGFVGPYLARLLLDRKAIVYGLVRRTADGLRPKSLGDRLQEVQCLEGDLTDISSLAFTLDRSAPDVIFHLGSQSFVPRSFTYPLDTLAINTVGTANLLEAVRFKGLNPIVVFAGSSEEYGLVISSKEQYDRVKKRYGTLFPEPETIPEVPITEKNPLRPMSPYAVSKVQGEYLMRNYYHSYGIRTVISRGFNHEGAGRPTAFVTSAITSQVMRLKFGETDRIIIGNVNAFRDWSHVLDIVKGYCLLAEVGKPGDAYNQGSMKTNSVLSYILLSLEQAGWKVERIETMQNNKVVEAPTERDRSRIFGIEFEKTRIDNLLLEGKLEFSIEDRGIRVYTDKGDIPVHFDINRFRPAEVPILFADTKKFQNLGFRVECKLEDIIRDQLNHFMASENRSNVQDIL
jgi:GDPmannose 4,6-dehydratase